MTRAPPPYAASSPLLLLLLPSAQHHPSCGGRRLLARLPPTEEPGVEVAASGDGDQRVPEHSRHHLSIHLIPLDSIATLFRADFSTLPPADLKRRSVLLFQTSAKFKEMEMAYKHQCVLLVTNQMVDVLEGDAGNTIAWSSALSPALGIWWPNCINRRLFLKRDLETLPCLLKQSEGMIKDEGRVLELFAAARNAWINEAALSDVVPPISFLLLSIAVKT